MSTEHDPTGDGRGPRGARRSGDLAPSPAAQPDRSAWAVPDAADSAWDDAPDGGLAAWDEMAPASGSAWDASAGPGGSVWDDGAPAPASVWAEAPAPAPERRRTVRERRDPGPSAHAPVPTPAPADVAPARETSEGTSTVSDSTVPDQVAAIAERLAAITGSSSSAPGGTGDPDDAGPATSRQRGRSAGRGYGGGAARRTGGGRRRAPAGEPPESGAASTDAEPDPESVARSIALRQLTAAPRSRAQLAEAMARRDVPEDVADRVLDRFTEVGLVDDVAYAEMLVRSRHAERGLSRRALAMELRRKGVDDGIAHEALSQVDDADEEQAARALARKKLRSTRGLDREVRLRRAYGALGRKGYGGSLVSRVVREELAAEGAADDDAGDGGGWRSPGVDD